MQSQDPHRNLLSVNIQITISSFRNKRSESNVNLSKCVSKRTSSSIGQTNNITLAGWPLGLGNELGHSSSLMRLLGIEDGVGVNGWKLEAGVSEDPAGVDSNSL